MIRHFNQIEPKIAKNAYIDEAAIIIGDVVIDEHSSIWPLTVVRGDVNHIKIGKKTNIQDGTICHVTHDGPYTPGGSPLIIGDNNTIGHQAMLHACTIDHNCLIGMGSILLDKCHIESNTLIGAGSLIAQGQKLESGYLWVGRPAKKVRKLSDKEIEQLHYSAEHYVMLAQKYVSLT